MVDDIGPLVQVVHVIATVIATVTEHQIQHKVLWESQKKNARKVRKVNAMTAKMLRASCRQKYVIIQLQHHRVSGEFVWTATELK